MKVLLRIGRITNDQRENARLSFFIALYFFLQAFNLFVRLANISIPGWNWLPKVFLAIVLMLCIPLLLERTRDALLCTEGLMFLLFVSSYLIGDHSGVDIQSIALDELTVFIPLGLCAFAIDNYDTMLISLHRWSIATHLVLYILFFMSITNGRYVGYTMSVGYALLLQEMIVADKAFKDKGAFDIALVVVDTLMIIILGSRGPILCFAVFMIMQVLTIAASRRGRVLVLMIGGGIAIGLYFVFPILIDGLSKISVNLIGTQSRTLRLLVSGNISYDAGRNVYIEYTRQRIAERPWFGWGLCGGWYNGVYPHNIAYELILSFGYPIGTIIILWIIYLIRKGLTCTDINKRRVVMIFFSYSISLLISGSFLMSSTFFILLLLCLKRTIVEAENNDNNQYMEVYQ